MHPMEELDMSVGGIAFTLDMAACAWEQTNASSEI